MTGISTDTRTSAPTGTRTGPSAVTPRGEARSFLFVLGSSRPDGNTELLARAAAEQLPGGVAQRWVDLAALPLLDFQDGRHESDSWPVDENEDLLRRATLEATDIVIASPL